LFYENLAHGKFLYQLPGCSITQALIISSRI
jgi:hypothetical protein